MQNNSFRPANLGTVAPKNRTQDLGRPNTNLLNGLFSENAKMNNTDNYKLIDVDKLVDFKEHPFQVREDAEMLELIESIKESGIMEAILVRPIDNGKYEILAGHRRTFAARKAGLYDIPARVLNVDDEEAVIIMTDTNLKRREKILPSERAKAYKMQIEAYKCQGKRNDLVQNTEKYMEFGQTLPEVYEVEKEFGQTLPGVYKFESRELVAKLNNMKARSLSNFIRLNNLIEGILEKVDNEEIPFMAGVALSFLTEEEQRIVFDCMEKGLIKKMDLKFAEELKAISKKNPGQINEAVITQMVSKEEKTTQETALKVFRSATKNAMKHFKKTDYSSRTVENINQKELEAIIIKAIEDYAHNK